MITYVRFIRLGRVHVERVAPDIADIVAELMTLLGHTDATVITFDQPGTVSVSK